MAPPVDENTLSEFQQYYEEVLDQLYEEWQEEQINCPPEDRMDWDEDLSKREAQRRAFLKYEELDSYSGQYASPEEIKIRKIVSLGDLNSLPSVKEKGGWNGMNIEDRNSLLWELGINSKRGWWEDIGTHKNQKEQIVFDKYVLGEERSDKDWVNLIIEGKNVASFDSRVYAKGDKSFYEEVKRMGGGKRGT